jgi:hypothetical protein
MKKSLAIIISSYFVLSSATVSITAYESRVASNNNIALARSEQENVTYAENVDKQLVQAQSVAEEKPTVLTATIAADNTKQLQTKAAAASNQALSRGGSALPKTAEKTVPAKTTVKAAEKTITPSKGAIELLDWWKQAKNVFKTGSTAVIQDVRTGKTFKIVRTMGSNHADCEAATKADADIIKSIWGGFSWDTRPVIVNVGGRRLAASMSSLPHAGVDSAPALATVDNRSEGYGRGQNLDIIKGNGMNGHFDVHFLNSTRHKDGQIDPRHQAAIKIAAKQ